MAVAAAWPRHGRGSGMNGVRAPPLMMTTSQNGHSAADMVTIVNLGGAPRVCPHQQRRHSKPAGCGVAWCGDPFRQGHIGSDATWAVTLPVQSFHAPFSPSETNFDFTNQLQQAADGNGHSICSGPCRGSKPVASRALPRSARAVHCSCCFRSPSRLQCSTSSSSSSSKSSSRRRHGARFAASRIPQYAAVQSYPWTGAGSSLTPQPLQQRAPFDIKSLSD